MTVKASTNQFVNKMYLSLSLLPLNMAEIYIAHRIELFLKYNAL
jgi:hypothetical protein